MRDRLADLLLSGTVTLRTIDDYSQVTILMPDRETAEELFDALGELAAGDGLKLAG